jgi:L-amino acid N-acyltransferase YncA
LVSNHQRHQNGPLRSDPFEVLAQVAAVTMPSTALVALRGVATVPAVADLVVRDAGPDDLPAITELHNALLATTAIEWTDTPHTLEERRSWFERQRATGYPVLVATEGEDVVGWASFGDFRDIVKWPGYRFTVEHTVHVRSSHWGRGVGRQLIGALVEQARSLGKHVLIAAVDGANDASIGFHEQLGFVQVARVPEVGAKLGQWLDLVLLQLRLDERSTPPG